MAESEHSEQVNLFRWVSDMARFDSRFMVIFAVPNGFRGNRETGAWMLSEGMRPGVPDVCVPVPCGPYHGLFIEMKSPSRKSKTGRGKGGVEPAQQWWLSRLGELGHRTAVCYSCREAQDVICGYFGIE